MKILIFSLLLLSFDFARAACTAPTRTSLGTGQAGEVKMSIGTTTTFNKLMYCDGTNWIEFPGSSTAFICAKNGEIYMSGGSAFYCNNLFAWYLGTVPTPTTSCTHAGETKWNSSTTKLEICDGTNYYPIDTADTTADPIADYSESGFSIESSRSRYFAVTGISGVTGTFSFDNGGGTCTSQSAKVCPDNGGCTSPLQTVTANGSATIPNGSFIRMAMFNSTQASTACSITGTIGGQTFTFTTTSTATDTQPTKSTTFTTLTNQPTTTAVASTEIMKLSAHTGITVNLSDNGRGGNPEIRVCDDATCSTNPAYVSPPVAVTNPQWVQIRVTTGGADTARFVTMTPGTAGAENFVVTTSSCPHKTTIAPGATLTCTCPAGTATLPVAVAGIDNYKQSSYVCAAALHAGAFSNATGGTITVVGTTAGTPSGTCPSFGASTRNGITSNTSGASTSFYFQGFGTDVCN